MESVVLTSGVRTAVGTFGGALSETPASDLAAHVFRQAVQRAGIHGEQVNKSIGVEIREAGVSGAGGCLRAGSPA